MAEASPPNGKKQLAGFAVWVAVVPIVLTIMTQGAYVVLWGSRTAQDVERHTVEIERLTKRMDTMDTIGSRPLQTLQDRVERIDKSERDAIDRFEKLKERIEDLKTPLALRVESMERQLNELRLKVDARLMELRR